MLDLRKQSYIDWNVKSVIKIIDRDKYAYRVVLKYQDGSNYIQQKGGFRTKKEAEIARQHTIGELVNGTYIVNDKIKVAEFLEYWMEHDIRQRVGSANTYDTFSSIVRNHIIPFWGNKLITKINRADVLSLYEHRTEYSVHIAKQVKVVLNLSFRYAKIHGFITINPTEGVSLPKKIVPSNPYHTRSINVQKTLTLEQMQQLIEASKKTKIYMQVLFNVLMGLRRQEINAVKYSDVDYINRTLSVERQLGKKLVRNKDEEVEHPTTKSEVRLKTESSRRILPIPDLVFEVILEERQKYERNRRRRQNDKRNPFYDGDYICCSPYGKPRSKDFHWNHYKNLLKKLDLPDIRWHDLRSTYCTLLLKSDFSPKAVSKLMGHAKEIITIDVYGDNKNIIIEEIPELLEYMDDVMPEKVETDSQEILDANIDIDEYFCGN